jgi:hypothetical protein
MEQVNVGIGGTGTSITASSNVVISTSRFTDTDGDQVVLAQAEYISNGELKELRVGRKYNQPEASACVEVWRAMKREALRELVTYLEMEGIL